MKLTVGLQQTIVTVKHVKNRQRSDFVGQNVFCFPFIANISNAIMSNQNAQIQRKIYEMYKTQRCSLCEISVKKQWSSQGCVERHLYSCYSVILMCIYPLTSPIKHILVLLPRLPLPRFQCPLSKLGCTAVHFVEPGVKLNEEYYRNNLLGQKLLSDVCRLSQDEFFVFQQDGAPAHRARDTISFLERETPDFIPPTLWPPNLPGLNPVEWSTTASGVFCRRMFIAPKIADVDELKIRLIDEWA